MSEVKKELTIIVLTYNSGHIISDCLKNLNFEKYEVVVVDNASKDNSVEVVKNNFPQVRVIKIEKNIGYGNGNNVALEQVNSEFALILNPDAIISEKDIEIVLSEMKKDELAAMAGPLVLDKYPLDQTEVSAKIVEMEQDLATLKDRHYEKVNGNFSVKFLIGAALFMKISLMKKVGFFDKKIFLYYEDDELCGRVIANGFRSLVVPNAVAFHVGGGSSKSSLRTTYKKSWHLLWSKLYWKKLRQGKLRSKRSAAKFVLVYFVKTLVSLLTLSPERIVSNAGALMAAFSSLIGLESFKKCGEPRG